jgi:hypothetical protein
VVDSEEKAVDETESALSLSASFLHESKPYKKVTINVKCVGVNGVEESYSYTCSDPSFPLVVTLEDDKSKMTERMVKSRNVYPS